jgi:hypothetical protein
LYLQRLLSLQADKLPKREPPNAFLKSTAKLSSMGSAILDRSLVEVAIFKSRARMASILHTYMSKKTEMARGIGMKSQVLATHIRHSVR